MRQCFLNRRQFLATTGAAAVATSRRQPMFAKDSSDKPALDWHDVSHWGIEGKGWQDTARYFDRFPAKAEKLVRPEVWKLSRHSAGMLCRFQTDATEIYARYQLLSAEIARPNISAIGMSGLDLYVRDAAGRQRWLGVARPTQQHVEALLATGLDALTEGTREYTLYLPLYNGVDSLEIGVPAHATLRPLPPREEKPLIFYGTSIMQGASASRPGMSITGIIGRRFDRPVINLGFSAHGRMESEVGQLLCELDPEVYVIDCLPNMFANEVEQRAEPLVHQLRKARPQTPIVLVEDRTFGYAYLQRASRERNKTSRAALRKAFAHLLNEGVKDLHYLAGASLVGDDALVDGSHPSDLGMVQYADAYQPILEKILGRS